MHSLVRFFLRPISLTLLVLVGGMGTFLVVQVRKVREAAARVDDI